MSIPCLDSVPSEVLAAVGAHVEDHDAVITPYLHVTHRLTTYHTEMRAIKISEPNFILTSLKLLNKQMDTLFTLLLAGGSLPCSTV